jgi:3-phosphoshikimate 1-carboxyvinyltransferase
VRVDGSLSSQFLSGLLFALPLCTGSSEIRVRHLRSTPYVALTLSLLTRFGICWNADERFESFSIQGGATYRPTSYRVEGDWSGAAFLLVAGAITGKVRVRNLQVDSLQADVGILEAIQTAGARVATDADSVTVEHNDLRGFSFDATDCPDLFPPLVALACHCRGTSLLYGADRLRSKESNRAEALLDVFSRVGARITLAGDRIEVEGTRLRGGVVDAHKDHRIAMAGALAGLTAEEGVAISGWKAVSKSFPAFFQVMQSIGASVE